MKEPYKALSLIAMHGVISSAYMKPIYNTLLQAECQYVSQLTQKSKTYKGCSNFGIQMSFS